MKPQVKSRAGLIGLALTFFLLLQILSKYPGSVEKYYSNGIYPHLTRTISGLSGNVPFSLTEMALWGVLIFGIAMLRRFWRRRVPVTTVLLNLILIACFFYIWFYVSWGINYFRQPLKSTLKMNRVQLPMNAFDSTFVQIIDKCNELNLAYPIRGTDEINAAIERSYERVLSELGVRLVPGYKGVKTFVGNWALNKTTTTGFFSPFFHEVHYNKDLLIFEQPFVIAHEKAHQMGYTSEAEANFLAFLVCTHSPDPLLQYSGYFSLVNYFLYNLNHDRERWDTHVAQLNEGVKLDRQAVQERWRSHVGWVSKTADRGYDLYLKVNRVPDGIQSYSRVVDLVIRYFVQHDLLTSQVR